MKNELIKCVLSEEIDNDEGEFSSESRSLTFNNKSELLDYLKKNNYKYYESIYKEVNNDLKMYKVISFNKDDLFVEIKDIELNGSDLIDLVD